MRLESLTLYSLRASKGAGLAAQSFGIVKGVNPVLTAAKPNRRPRHVNGDCLVQTSGKSHNLRQEGRIRRKLTSRMEGVISLG
jgi:hypothetical protein